MVDRYTKGVLTVIAVALTVIAFRQAVPGAHALGDGCGDMLHSCYVQTLTPLQVTVR